MIEETVYTSGYGKQLDDQYVAAPHIEPVPRSWGPAYALDPQAHVATVQQAQSGALVPYAPVEAYVPADNFYTREMATAPMRPARIVNPLRYQVREKVRAPRFWKQFLALTNYYREKHDSPVLGWSPQATLAAQTVADRLAQLDVPGLYPNEPGELGQNFFTVESAFNMSKLAATTRAVEKWYLENAFYDYSSPTPGLDVKTRNFVNLVWKDVTSVGGGVAESRRGNVYVVAFYYPKPKTQQLIVAED